MNLESLGHRALPCDRSPECPAQSGQRCGAIVANRGNAPLITSRSHAHRHIRSRRHHHPPRHPVSTGAAAARTAARGSLLRLLRVVPAAVRYLFDRDRGALKQSLLRATLRGTPRDELAAAVAGFVRDTIEHALLSRCADRHPPPPRGGPLSGAHVGKRRLLRAGVRPAARLRPGDLDRRCLERRPARWHADNSQSAR